MKKGPHALFYDKKSETRIQKRVALKNPYYEYL